MYKLGAVNAVYSSATSSYLSRGMGIMASPLCVCVFVAAVCCVVVFDDVLLYYYLTFYHINNYKIIYY